MLHIQVVGPAMDGDGGRGTGAVWRRETIEREIECLERSGEWGLGREGGREARHSLGRCIRKKFPNRQWVVNLSDTMDGDGDGGDH